MTAPAFFPASNALRLGLVAVWLVVPAWIAAAEVKVSAPKAGEIKVDITSATLGETFDAIGAKIGAKIKIDPASRAEPAPNGAYIGETEKQLRRIAGDRGVLIARDAAGGGKITQIIVGSGKLGSAPVQIAETPGPQGPAVSEQAAAQSPAGRYPNAPVQAAASPYPAGAGGSSVSALLARQAAPLAAAASGQPYPAAQSAGAASNGIRVNAQGDIEVDAATRAAMARGAAQAQRDLQSLVQALDQACEQGSNCIRR